MTITIYGHDGDYEYEPIATFEDGEWIEGGERVDPDDYYVGAPEDVVEADFDGPDLVAADPNVVTEPAEADT